MAFARAKRREPVGEAGLFEYAVGVLARRMRTVRDLRRLMRAGFSSVAIYKVLRDWELPVEAMPVEGGADSDSYAERDEDLPEF